MPDKTITQKPVTRGDLVNVTVVIASPATWSALYTPHDAAGAKIGQPRSFSAAYGSDTDFLNWLTNIVLPAINAAEGT